MTHSAVKCSKMEIQEATNRGNYYEDNGLAKGWGCRRENKSGRSLWLGLGATEVGFMIYGHLAISGQKSIIYYT